ncbi:porin family protein [Pseudopedobacter beijingensis]|uniref:Porin family protein n=1 Tax=Pseudopedobacter beijingensis TaxID=1207056 RepID=A0ABW4IAV1_9SPHI
MKKVLFLFAALIVSTSASAQFEGGIKAGINYSTIKAEKMEVDGSGILGYNVGLWGRIGKAFYIQPEIYLGSKGADFKIKENGTSIEQSGKVKFTTLDIPALIGTKAGFKNFNLRFMAGPAFQFNLNTDESALEQVIDPDFYKYKSFVTNIQGGLGIDFSSLSLDARYETGLQDINKEDGQRQSLVHLSLGFKF